MAWPRAILTDSGGFQVFSLNGLRKITEEGVLFHSHLNGDAHMFTPESTIDVQLALGSDIMMVLDECLEYPASHEAARVSTERTVRWARAAPMRTTAQHGDDGLRACFPIVQGSMFADLRRALRRGTAGAGCRRLRDRRTLGGRAARAESGDGGNHRAALPRDRPRYVMGVGMPEELPEYVARGIDMMDCVLPSRNARNGYLFTSGGARGHQADPIQRRPAARWTRPAPAIPAGTFRGPICATCFWPER